MSVNRVIVMGNMTRDPVLSYTPSNAAVCSFGLAVNERRKAADGSSIEEAHFFECTAFGKTAEVINQHLSKGRKVLVDGKLRYQSWADKEGRKRSKVDILVSSFEFMDSRPSNEHQPSAPPENLECEAGSDIPF